MMISTRGRYALRVIIDIAENSNGNYIAMKEVAERQDISLKYLEKILPMLVKGGLVEGVHGKGGGYRLTTTPDRIKVSDVIKYAEGDISPVSCLEAEGSGCDRKDSCKTLPLWIGLNKTVLEYLDKWYVSDLM